MPSLAPGRGIACIVFGSALLTLNDAVMKLLADDYPVGEILCLRACAIFIPTIFLIWYLGGIRTMRIYNVQGQTIRAILGVCTASLFLFGLSYLPLADAIALTFSGPIFTVALAGLILRERVGWHRWTAVSIGFVGVLIMLQPGTDALRLAAFLPLSAAFFGAIRDIVTRSISVSESSIAVLFYSTLAVSIAGILTLPFGWRMLTAGDFVLVTIAGILQGFAHYLFIEAYRLAQAAIVVPYKYLQLIWAVLFGFLIWGEVPGKWIILGSVLVIASGIYNARRDNSYVSPPRTL